jgi:hypothetical protein
MEKPLPSRSLTHLGDIRIAVVYGDDVSAEVYIR